VLVGVVYLVTKTDDSSAPLARCGRAVERGARHLDVGDRVPNFTLPSLDGSCVELSEFRGRPLVINFWASWCNPCRDEFPLLAEARERHEDDELEIFGITHDDIVSDSRRFAEEQGASWPMLVDEDNAVADVFRIGQIPQSFFIDASGRVRAHIFGFTSTRDLEAQIRRALAD